MRGGWNVARLGVGRGIHAPAPPDPHRTAWCAGRCVAQFNRLNWRCRSQAIDLSPLVELKHSRQAVCIARIGRGLSVQPVELPSSEPSPQGLSLPGDTVDRLLYASLSCVTGSVFEGIRDHANQRNVSG